jgi:hypothetical protein
MEKLEPANNNSAGNFNSRVNELSAINTANRTQINVLISEATTHLAQLDGQIVVANDTITTLRDILTAQSAAFVRNQTTRNRLTSIEQQIPLRLQQYPELSNNATNLQAEASQYVIGSSVLAASPVLSELVALGKQIGRVIAVNSAENFIFTTSPSGNDRMSTGCFQIQQPAGTGGGSATPGVWTERLMNNPLKSEGGMILENGRISLPPGSYAMWGFIACCQCGRFKSQLVNRSTNATYKGSNVASSIGGDDFNGFSYVDATFTLTATNSFSLETMVEFQHANPLFTNGAPVNVSGAPEVYGSIVVLKLT